MNSDVATIEIYNKIAANIIRAIPVEWKQAQLIVEVSPPGYNAYDGFYLDHNNQKENLDVALFDSDLAFDLIDLHAVTYKSGNYKWNHAFFTLEPDRRFNIEFIWNQEWQNKIDAYNR